jgi:hypothetical protein
VDLLPDALEVVRRLIERVRLSVEEVEVLGPVGLAGEQVVGREPELLDELAQRLMAGVDQLPAVLGDLAVGEDAADAPAAAARAVRGLVELGGVPGLLEPVGRVRPASPPPTTTMRGAVAACASGSHGRASATPAVMAPARLSASRRVVPAAASAAAS